jgi:pimeloyl-ACP methyl ester carboxylesterase
MAYACLCHDAYEKLEKIQAETFVIGGALDRTLGAKASLEIAEKIPNAELKMYEKYGHALYDEAKDFIDVVLRFLNK